jgi:hypothetical protein
MIIFGSPSAFSRDLLIQEMNETVFIDLNVKPKYKPSGANR